MFVNFEHGPGQRLGFTRLCAPHAPEVSALWGTFSGDVNPNAVLRANCRPTTEAPVRGSCPEITFGPQPCCKLSEALHCRGGNVGAIEAKGHSPLAHGDHFINEVLNC